jgi:hypothetical protein
MASGGGPGMNKRKKIAIALLVLVLAALIVGPVFAALLWEHRWDARTVIIDRLGSSYFHSYGHSNWMPWEGTQTYYKILSCSGSKGERVRLVARQDGAVSIMGGCAVMTPTPYRP